ncbi:MAG: 50S ribosomal protein L30 [Nitrospirales bacterium]|jgi:large subunit ribosomal protein L30
MNRVSITLKNSPIGRPSKQRVLLLGLGLRRLHQTVEHPQTPQVLGLIDKVKHLVEVTSL